MLSDAIRRRLEQLDRAPLQRARAASPGSGPERAGPHSQVAGPREELALFRPGDGSPIEGLAGAVQQKNGAGAHLRLRRRLTAFCPRASLQRSYCPPGPTAPPVTPGHPELAALAAQHPHGALYLDLETCGFAGSMIFLVGLVWSVDGELWLDQLLARNYAEERAVLATLWQIAAEKRVLVTFNGKSFDWPMVKDRSTLHRLAPILPEGSTGGPPKSAAGQTPIQAAGSGFANWVPAGWMHCDLLHHSRRRWRGRLPDCRLQTLERWICRRHRSGDVSGAEVPRVYHDYVRHGDLRVIQPVLHHNALDLVTLVQIGQALLTPALATAESA